ncbi:MAG: PP2C family protein-serine/threonine phosphatase [Clostridium sp.]|uniref:PP2C family protein-serine/threonine phosphatase n=1 Tax=Clostridium sp. LY3-2 TaxID=2942482 RepID=UPI0021520620|nr:protein phosphatase 2C domain-containing protein [Clostridium sp. LY3-2]MCR6515214.1 protein phosphatase 2C domain-containing protein [Clostridium sp. LY3-2]
MDSYKIEVAAISDKGLVKESNQDNILIQIGDHAGSDFGLFMVCDGLGGLAFGEVASVIAVKKFKAWWSKEVCDYVKKESDEILNSLVNAVKEANVEIIDYSNKIGQRVGTTISAILILKNFYYIVHVGDSRIYRFRRRLKQITEDHSYVAMEVKAGRMTKEEAKASNKKNLLMQCVGVKENIEIFLEKGKIQKGDIFLLCSDGFYNKLTDYELEIGLNNWRATKGLTSKALIDGFFEKVKERKERDNISVIMVSLSQNNIKNDSFFRKIFKY